MTNSKLRGHHIIFVGGQWLYADNKQHTIGNERPCGYCGKENTREGHDSCLGILPGIMNACCGHGDADEAYVQFGKNKTIRVGDAVDWIIENHQKYELKRVDKEHQTLEADVRLNNLLDCLTK